MNESELAAGLRRRDPEALRAVVDATLPHLLRAARGAGLNAQRAEDVVQETLMTMLEKAHSFEGRSRVRTWVFGILYRKILEAWRSGARDLLTDDIDETMESRFLPDGRWSRPPRPADAELFLRQVRDHLTDCMESVPAMQSAAFSLKEVDGFSTEEICKMLGVSRTNLGVLLYRARNRLRECLEGKGIDGEEHADL